MALYAAAMKTVDLPMNKASKNLFLEAFVRPNGRNERIRTSYPFVPKENLLRTKGRGPAFAINAKR